MAFRSDDQIRAWIEDSMGEIGFPRCLILAGLLPNIGLEPTDEQYQRFVYEYDDPAWAAVAAPQQSGCGLFTGAGWRWAGVQAPILYMPYQERTSKGGIYYAVSHEMNFAKEHDTWVSALPWVEGTPLPGPSDAPIIGMEGGGYDFVRNTAAVTHEFTVGAWDPDVPSVSHNLDGGQPGTAFRSRAWIEVWTGEDSSGRRTGELWCGAVNDDGSCTLAYDKRPATGRRCIGYTNTAGLPYNPPPGHDCQTSSGRVVTSLGGESLLPYIPNEGLAVLAAAGGAVLLLTPGGRAALAGLQRYLQRLLR